MKKEYQKPQIATFEILTTEFFLGGSLNEWGNEGGGGDVDEDEYTKPY